MDVSAGELGPLRIAQWVRVRWWNACAWYAVTLAEALARRGHRSFLLAPSWTPAAREAESRGIASPQVGDLGSSAPLGWLRSERKLRRFLREERIDLVNVHSGPGHARLALLCHRLGIPVVRTRGDIRPPRSGPLMRWLYARRTVHHLAAAEFIRRDYYRALGVPAERITTLRGGIDLEILGRVSRPAAGRQIRQRLGLDAAVPLVGMVGRLSPVKGHVHFINAMARVAHRHPSAHLVIVGPEAQFTLQDLAEVARAQGLGDRTHLVGRVEDPLVWSAGLDVAVVASVDSEAICRSTLEFLGLGTPLIATRVHAIPEVAIEGTCLLVPPADPERLAGALELLLDSPELRASLAEAGERHVRAHYSLDQFGSEAEDLFRRLIREEHPGAGNGGERTRL